MPLGIPQYNIPSRTSPKGYRSLFRRSCYVNSEFSIDLARQALRAFTLAYTVHESNVHGQGDSGCVLRVQDRSGLPKVRDHCSDVIVPGGGSLNISFVLEADHTTRARDGQDFLTNLPVLGLLAVRQVSTVTPGRPSISLTGL
jgi:hypothetical protein